VPAGDTGAARYPVNELSPLEFVLSNFKSSLILRNCPHRGLKADEHGNVAIEPFVRQ
jgi:hypothetical protein